MPSIPEPTSMEDDLSGQKLREISEALAAIVGGEHVVTDEAERALLSHDLAWMPTPTATLAIRPGTVEELAAAVGAATEAGLAIAPRGGGMSYSGGYAAQRAGTLLIDLRRLDKIVEINAADQFVTVEAGCTWKQLQEATREHGVRTPFWGPLSGIRATVGGALSQNAMFFGSGVYGAAAESVLGLDVVLADGSVVRTGSGAVRAGSGFSRNNGPDLSGLFLGDTGAYGVKARATLKLIPLPAATRYASFAFETFAQMVAALTAVARTRLAAECYGFDPYFHSTFAKRGFTFFEGLDTLGSVARSNRSRLSALGDLWRIARGGKRFLQGVNYSLHLTVDGHEETAAQRGLEVLRKIALREGREIENTLPKVIRAKPFGPIRAGILGVEGQRWLPLHALLPLSKAGEAIARTERICAAHRGDLERHNIAMSYLTAAGGSEFLLEPAFNWFDELTPLHRSLIDPAEAARLQSIPANPEARETVERLRVELRDCYTSMGAIHLQIGRYYPYLSTLEDNTAALANGIKRLLDPRGLMNPGALEME